MLRSQLSAVIGNCWLSALAGVALAAAGMLFGERRGFARSLEKALWYTAFFLSLVHGLLPARAGAGFPLHVPGVRAGRRLDVLV